MADLNIQSNHGNYTDNIQSNQLNSMNSSDDHHTNGCPLNQTIPTDFDYTNMEQPIPINSNGVYSYHHSQMPPQPSDMGFLNHDSIYMGMNEFLNTENYGRVGNGENGANYSTMNYNSSNYNPHSIYCLPPQTFFQTPPVFTLSNNAGVMTNATSHGCTVIIIKADINLEKLLSIIQ